MIQLHVRHPGLVCLLVLAVGSACGDDSSGEMGGSSSSTGEPVSSTDGPQGSTGGDSTGSGTGAPGSSSGAADSSTGGAESSTGAPLDRDEACAAVVETICEMADTCRMDIPEQGLCCLRTPNTESCSSSCGAACIINRSEDWCDDPSNTAELFNACLGALAPGCFEIPCGGDGSMTCSAADLPSECQGLFDL